MSTPVALQVSSRWAILSDGLQWVVACERKRGTERDWKPVAYIGSTKATLRRVLRERGIVITDPDVQAALDSWPERFLDWQRRGVRAA